MHAIELELKFLNRRVPEETTWPRLSAIHCFSSPASVSLLRLGGVCGNLGCDLGVADG
jgi:hypothetical protein